MKRRSVKIVAMVTTLSVFLLAAKPVQDNYFAIVKNLDIFASLYKELNAHYVDELNPNQLIKTGVDAMLLSLDPYTNYIPEDKIENYRTMTTGEYGGIGAVVQEVDGINTVIMSYEGYPAHDAGLLIGDQVLEINGVDLSGKTGSEISTLLKGQSDSGIVLKVKRYNQPQPFDLTVSREKITLENVPYYGMIDEKTGYLKLTNFMQKAGLEVKNAVEELKKEGAESIILDVRGNPGGLLLEAVNIVNVFLPKGNKVVYTKGKRETSNNPYFTLNEPVDTEIPLVVLTGRNSASASEIVAGAIQDYDRGVLIGRKTFGKGLVQITRQLSYNNQLKVTTAKYYIPSGRCIQAIDYANRNPDGSVGKIPDSLKVAFRTAAGREVYDGGGIDPDVTVKEKEPSELAVTLNANYLLFHYATKYYFEHKEIGDPRNFSLTEQEYQEFISWLNGKEYQYTTQGEKQVKELTEKLTEAEESLEVLEHLNTAMQEYEKMKKTDLITHKAEIKKMLEENIASRYYLEDGLIEVSFRKDKDIKEALRILGNRAEYTALLSNNP